MKRKIRLTASVSDSEKAKLLKDTPTGKWKMIYFDQLGRSINIHVLKNGKIQIPILPFEEKDILLEALGITDYKITMVCACITPGYSLEALIEAVSTQKLLRSKDLVSFSLKLDDLSCCLQILSKKTIKLTTTSSDNPHIFDHFENVGLEEWVSILDDALARLSENTIKDQCEDYCVECGRRGLICDPGNNIDQATCIICGLIYGGPKLMPPIRPMETDPKPPSSHNAHLSRLLSDPKYAPRNHKAMDMLRDLTQDKTWIRPKANPVLKKALSKGLSKKNIPVLVGAVIYSSLNDNHTPTESSIIAQKINELEFSQLKITSRSIEIKAEELKYHGLSVNGAMIAPIEIGDTLIKAPKMAVLNELYSVERMSEKEAKKKVAVALHRVDPSLSVHSISEIVHLSERTVKKLLS